MNNLEFALILTFFIGLIGLIFIPLLLALLILFLTKLFKFKRTKFITSLWCSLIIFGSIIFSYIFLNNILFHRREELSSIFMVISLFVAFLTGGYAIYKFYNENSMKSFLLSFLSVIILFITFAILGYFMIFIIGAF